jgi:hypothetical protein
VNKIPYADWEQDTGTLYREQMRSGFIDPGHHHFALEIIFCIMSPRIWANN